jgi:nucleoid DNA-binding protein
MKREDLARKLASETCQSRAQAQDQIDELVHDILKSLRAGRSVKLPGVGKLKAGVVGRARQ